MRKDVPLAVELPSPERDRPAWVKVGVIAAVGFIVGVAWPRLVGVRLGPSAPGESAAAASATGAAAARAPEAPPATSIVAPSAAAAPVVRAAAAAAAPEKASAGVEKAGVGAERPADKTSGPPKISIAKGSVQSCKTRDGETKTGKECGPVTGLDLVVRPRVRNIASCAGAEGQTGKVAMIVNADFGAGRFSYDVLRSSTVRNLDAIGSCLKSAFDKTTIATGVPHEHARYRVLYNAMLSAGGGASDETSADTSAAISTPAKADKPLEKATEDAPKAAPAAAAGEAVVAWEVALVRDTPKVGGVVARLPRGTKVKLGASKEGWYSVKFGDDFGEGGWVYRGAIGR